MVTSVVRAAGCARRTSSWAPLCSTCVNLTVGVGVVGQIRLRPAGSRSNGGQKATYSVVCRSPGANSATSVPWMASCPSAVRMRVSCCSTCSVIGASIVPTVRGATCRAIASQIVRNGERQHAPQTSPAAKPANRRCGCPETNRRERTAATRRAQRQRIAGVGDELAHDECPHAAATMAVAMKLRRRQRRRESAGSATYEQEQAERERRRRRTRRQLPRRAVAIAVAEHAIRNVPSVARI